MTTLLEINMTTHLTSKSVKALMISEFPGDDRLCYSWTIAGGRPNADFTRFICASLVAGKFETDDGVNNFRHKIYLVFMLVTKCW